MNTRASMARRDGMLACIFTLAVAVLLFAWSPSLHPGFSPPRLAPPTITYCSALLTDDAHQEHYDEWNAVHSPALIALSAAMMLPTAKNGQTNAITPPLDAASRFLCFTDTSATKQDDPIPMLTPPRPMNPLASQRFAVPAPIPAGGAIRTRNQPPPQPSCRVDLIGNWQGHSVDLAPMSTLSEPSGPWSFTAVLRYDETGRVQHALLESAALDLPLRDEVVRRLYQCRVTPSGTPGEGRLTVSGPGRASRP